MPRRILAAAAVLMVALAAPAAAAPAKPKPWVFVLAGQSHMAGRGLPLPAPVVTPGIMQSIRRGVVPAVDPLNGEQGVGPGLTFARAVRKAHPGRRIILVPCAKGATSITQWRHNSFLYDRCIRWARQAHGTIKGVLFAQGESDASSYVDASKWRWRFERFARQFRRSLGAPRTPFIYATLGHTTQPARFFAWGAVRRQQDAAHVAHSAAVRMGDLRLQDNVHLTANGYRILGGRMAAAWRRLAR